MAGSLASEDGAVNRHLWHGTLCEGRILFSRPRALGCAGWWTETCAIAAGDNVARRSGWIP